MTTIMGYRDDYEIYFSHQYDDRPFNRGAAKNIGFLAIKEKYPDHYRDITFVFNDIDTIPFSAIFNYETSYGIVKHFYGFKYALGGIVSIKGSDFEATNGFPNYWGWGMEDTVLYNRCLKIGLTIDRSDFHAIGSPNIIHLFDGVSRIINKLEPEKAKHDNGKDGLASIRRLSFNIDFESANLEDNLHVIISDKIFYVNISSFITNIHFDNDNYYSYDLRDNTNTMGQARNKRDNSELKNNNDWTQIPIQGSLSSFQNNNNNNKSNQQEEQLRRYIQDKQQIQQEKKRMLEDEIAKKKAEEQKNYRIYQQYIALQRKKMGRR